jgi:hypothetical protein
MRCSPSLLLLVPLWLPAGLAVAAPKYQIVNTTEFGKAFVAQRQDARTLSAALRLTLSDITAYLGSAPSSYRAYSDTRDASSGGATFLANAGGVALKGLVTCKVGQKGTRVAVVMIRADAPPNEFGRLLNPEAPNTPAAPASADGKAIATSHAPLRTYSFPDGTGTIGLAEGWSTNGESCLRMVQLQGPVNEGITMGASFSIVTPGARFRAPGALVAQFTTPAEVLQAVMPQLSQMGMRQGEPMRELDSVVTVADQQPYSPRGKLAILRWGVTESSNNGSRAHYQVFGQVALTPLNANSFTMRLTGARAPDASFEHDLPVMLEMINSLKTNDAQIRARNGQGLAAQKNWFANQQKAHKQQVAAFDAHNRQWEASEKAFDERNQRVEDAQNTRARSNDNFDELIRGYRTVEDTETGIKKSLDLGNVDKIVDDLNEYDPGRYREIPLRDEVDPLQ